MSFTSHTKNSSTRIGIRQVVTSITARASKKRFSTFRSFSTEPAEALVMLSATLEKNPERPLCSVSAFSLWLF